MRSLILSAVMLLACSSFLNVYWVTKNLKTAEAKSKNILDLTVRRLSGERVMLAWHTEGDNYKAIYEVLRKHKARDQFISLGVASPESKQDNTADYSFVDTNDFADSSFYCLKKTNADSVVFYSVTKGVEGVGKER